MRRSRSKKSRAQSQHIDNLRDCMNKQKSDPKTLKLLDDVIATMSMGNDKAAEFKSLGVAGGTQSVITHIANRRQSRAIKSSKRAKV